MTRERVPILERVDLPFRKFLESLGEAVVVMNLDGTLAYANIVARDYLGFGRFPTTLESWARTYGIFRPDKISLFGISDLPLARALNGQVVDREELYIKNDNIPNGAFFAITARPINDGGEIIGAIGVYSDISNEKMLEHLWGSVTETVVHELRTPTTAVRGFLSMMADGDFGKVPSSLSEPLSDAIKAVERQVAIIDEIVEAEDLDGPSKVSGFRAVAVGVTVCRECESFRTLAEERKINLGVIIEPDVEHCLSLLDRQRFALAIKHILDNAFKFTQQGEICIRGSHDGKFIKVLIEDTGCGISPDENERIFARFYQIKDKAGGKPRGLGIGLYIARRIMRSFGGDLWLDSSGVGRGSVFAFTVPILIDRPH